jgi:phage terminase small subunit
MNKPVSPLEQPAPPAHLTKQRQDLWRSLLNEYVFSTGELETLRLGLEALDRAEEAREAVAAAGPYFIDRYGQPRPHPGLQVEHTARLDFLKVARELNLAEGEDEAPRPPSIKGRYAK